MWRSEEVMLSIRFHSVLGGASLPSNIYELWRPLKTKGTISRRLRCWKEKTHANCEHIKNMNTTKILHALPSFLPIKIFLTMLCFVLWLYFNAIAIQLRNTDKGCIKYLERMKNSQLLSLTFNPLHCPTFRIIIKR